MAFVTSGPLQASSFSGYSCSLSQRRFAVDLKVRDEQVKWRQRPSRLVRRNTLLCAEKGISFPNTLDGSKFRIGVVWTRWNGNLVTPMVEEVKKSLAESKVDSKNIVEMQVPGAFEVPMAARLMCAAQKVDALICVGVLIKGETDHYEYIAGPVSQSLMDLQMATNIPVVFGVLTCRDYSQAEARSTGDKSEASAWGRTAIEMATLRASQVGGVVSGKKSVGF